MLFNSIDFVVFLPIVFCLYWFVTSKNLKLQNLLIVGASYLFYGWWDWKFLTLIFISTIVDYSVGIGLLHEKKQLKRILLLWISIFVNLGFLGFFKYYNFFLENFQAAFSIFGLEFSARSLSIILPVGISFYTFQTLSYSIDVYRKKLKPSTDFIAFSAFVCFFPQLVAGPIERAKHLLPQFNKRRDFNPSTAAEGMRQILWGLFKKVVIADNCAEYANLIFSNPGDYSGSTLVLGAVFFTFQIYGDFSGYSDIAIGVAKLFGFNLMQNFAFPYFSRDIAEFWRRWHISLSSWFRDYLYIPLGGSRGGLWLKIRNTFIIFVVSGFWHGANWTFIFWGFLNALYFLPLMLSNNNRNNIDVVANESLLPSIRDILSILITFTLTMFAWIFFRAENLSHAFEYINGIFHMSIFTSPEITPFYLFIYIIIFMAFEWYFRRKQFGFQFDIKKSYRLTRWTFYLIISFLVAFHFGKGSSFIYFQF